MPNPWEQDWGSDTATEAPPWEQSWSDSPATPASEPTAQLKAYVPPSLASRALEATREFLSPVLGPTETMRLRDSIPWTDASGNETYVYKPLGSKVDQEGLAGALSHPMVELPKFKHERTDNKVESVGKAVANTAIGFGEFFESPMGLATVGATAGAKALTQLPKVISGAFAGDLAMKLPEAIGKTRDVIADPKASFGDKAEAVIGTGTQAVLVGTLAKHTLTKEKPVNAEAKTLETELTGSTELKTEPAVKTEVASATPEPKPWEMEYAGGELPKDGGWRMEDGAGSRENTARTPQPETATPEPSPRDMEYAGGEMPVDNSKFPIQNVKSDSQTIHGRADEASYALYDELRAVMSAKPGPKSVAVVKEKLKQLPEGLQAEVLTDIQHYETAQARQNVSSQKPNTENTEAQRVAAVMSKDLQSRMRTERVFLNADVNRQQAMLDEHAPARKMVEAQKLLSAIADKDPAYLFERNNGMWQSVWKAFEAETGIKPGKTQKAIGETIRNFVGAEKYDRYVDDRTKAREDKLAADEAASKQRQRDYELKKQYRYALGGSGEVKNFSAKEIIEDIVSRGYTRAETVKRGVANVLRLWKDGTQYMEFRPKAEQEYARELVGKLEAKPVETTVEAGTSTVLDKVKAGSVETPAQGVLNQAIKLREDAWKRVQTIRQQIKDRPLGAGNLRIDLIRAQDAHREALRMEQGAKEAIENRANESGQTTTSRKAAKPVETPVEAVAKAKVPAVDRLKGSVVERTPAAPPEQPANPKIQGQEFITALENTKTKWGGPTTASEIGAQTSKYTKALVDAGLSKSEAERVRSRATSYRVGHILRETTKADFVRAMQEMGIVKFPEVTKPVETPVEAVAKVQEHVADVASGAKPTAPKAQDSGLKTLPATGTRPAKEIKSELVQRLEKAIEDAPKETDLSPAARESLDLARSSSFSELPDKPAGYTTAERLKFEKERRDKMAEIRGQRTAAAKEQGLSQVTIDIPGDGTFTIWNTKEALTEVRDRAAKINVSSGTPDKTAFTKTKASGNVPADIWVNSSEPTHVLTIKGLIGSSETLFKLLGRPIEIKAFPGESLFLTSDGQTFAITEPQTGLRIGSGDTIPASIKDAEGSPARLKEKGTKLTFQQIRDENVKQNGRRPAPQPVQPTPTQTNLGGLEAWADKQLKGGGMKFGSGPDPAQATRFAAAVAIKGSYVIARGVRDFAAWSAEMIRQLPELANATAEQLRALYARAVDIAEGRDPEIGLSVRGMKVKADTSLSEEVRQNTEAAYAKRVSADDVAEAKRLVQAAGGPEAAARDMLSGLWKPVPDTVQVKGAGEILAGLADLERRANDIATQERLADLQVRIAEHSTAMATRPAQWLQAFASLYGNYTPAAWLKEWRKGIDAAAKTRIERATGKPTGNTAPEMAQDIAQGVAEGVRADAPTTAAVIESVYGGKGKPGETATQAVERIIGAKGEQAQRAAKKIQDFYEREVNKFKKRHKIPELTPEDQRSILAEAKAIERLPADSLQRREAVLRLLDSLHRRKGFEWWELPVSFWYANTLSGPTTHAKNILGNSVNLGMEAGMQALLKPTNIPVILESLGRSLSVGGKEAWSILRTGHDTAARHGDKFELRRNPMELQTGALDKILYPWKMVGRLLRAEDAVFFNAGQEMRAAILSAREKGGDVAGMREAMGWTPEARTKAEAQATAEGLTGLNYQRRVNEIIEQGRSNSVMNAAREFGYDVTFNNEPYGVLGAFTSAINRGFDAAPILKPFILPFTRIVANVTNSSLNWTPVGTYRALRGQRKLAWLGRAENSGKLYGREINDPLSIRDAHARALLGTAAIIGVTAAAIKNIFDDDPQFMVTGSGPADKEQRDALRAVGWIPFSVKVGDRYYSYADKPPQMALAMVGHYLDAIRYKNLGREDALNRFTYALNGNAQVLLQSSWLQGLSSLFNQANRDSVKNNSKGLVQQVSRTGSGFVVPAALRQLDQYQDPTRYTADGVQGMLIQQVPWARRSNMPDLNAFGEPISSPTSKIFWSKVEGNSLAQRLAGNRVFPSVPNMGDLTPQEHYALVKFRGPILKEMLATRADEWMGAPRLLAQDAVNRISAAATLQAKAELGLDEANSIRREMRKATTK